MTYDAELEGAITTAGRDEVFAIVRAAGWSVYDSIPKHVWWEACRTVNAEKQTGLTLDE